MQLPIELSHPCYHDEDAARSQLEAIRWPDGIVACPTCGSEHVTYLEKQRRYKCYEKHPRAQFSLKVGTIFEDSAIGLEKWLPALWLLTNCKNGISSYELARALGVTQKTAWFMLSRLRLALQPKHGGKLNGEVEADESFIGGKARNMHAAKRREKIKGTGVAGKTAVMGLLERTTSEKPSKVILKVIQTTRKGELQGNVRQYVLKGAQVNTDALPSYKGLADEFTHNVIDHAECYAKGHVHTNGMENFWSLLKRTVKGTYVSVEPFHLFRYLDEQAYRFNERKDDDSGRFLGAIRSIDGKHLSYQKLTGKEPKKKGSDDSIAS